jgi:hypothetical protein
MCLPSLSEQGNSGIQYSKDKEGLISLFVVRITNEQNKEPDPQSEVCQQNVISKQKT